MKHSDNIPWKLIHKALKGSLEVRERKILDRWLALDPVNREVYRNIRVAWNVSASEHAQFQPDEEAAWDRIVRDAKIRVADNRAISGQKVRKMVAMMRNVAAILFLPLVVTTALLFLRSTEPSHPVIVSVATDAGQRTQFTLDDGTRVWLNSNSQLTYHQDGNSADTRVRLEGEAYFSVPPQRKHPLVVATSHKDIRVLGTSFNVRAYEKEDVIETVLENGAIELELHPTAENESRMVVLRPDQRAVLSKTDHTLDIRDGNTYEFTAWKDGVLAFRNISFDDLARRLEDWFNVDIQYEPDRFNDQKYSGIFRNRENLDQVLQSIKMVTPFEYQVENNRIIIN